MSSEALPLTWTDIDEIGFLLSEKHPALNPLEIRFTALRDLVLSLPNFTSEKEKCNERILEAIQMSWLDEFDGD
ncbi:MAG TPA: Fe-S cluster assembly protein IscX [Planctomycetota bacterium]|jgi:FeS assembly protein IscX|nr:Fe-S assembly protein IscX [Planctomycetota bacterium]MDP6128616.1 Fe-S cluster assembly protein IscX [Planctomycetota bacterium]MDP7246221.1 Fe-S cluster assembly protein IscX [Planctomycetota bacterium]MDP7559976.1 Fe-S cluster assembly protein IscX [Planctomycetota bacterium]HJM38539.1 Fe-S cluster assembly protein IscX [Planctomycetota bacterium]|tara:strand:+ start:22270 stop:22491 length:222 start_codon:yes stop_codon:yes gene_type:complete